MSDLHIEACERISALYDCDFEEAAELLELSYTIVELCNHIAKKEGENNEKNRF